VSVATGGIATLNIILQGTGGGTVKSIPETIDCANLPGLSPPSIPVCTGSFQGPTAVGLVVFPDLNSVVGGTSGGPGCAGLSVFLTPGAVVTCQVTFNAVGGITLDITSTRCDVLDVQLQHIIASGTVTGPLFTNLSSGFLGDFRCPAWSGGFCTRRSGDPVFSTWTSSVSINVPLGGQFSLKVDAVAGNTKTSAIGSVTCPKAF